MARFILIFSIIFGIALLCQAGEKEDYYSITRTYQDGFYALTIRGIDGFLKKYPRSLYRDDLLVLKAVSLYNLNKYPQATDIFNALKDSSNPKIRNQAYFYLGKLYHRAGETAKAEEMFRYAWENIKDKKLKALSGYELGIIYFENRNYDSAIKLWEQVVNIESLPREEKAAIVNNLLYIYILEKEWKKASELLSKHFKPQDREYLYFQARLELAKRNLKKAEEISDTILKNNFSALWNQKAKLIQIWAGIEKGEFQKLDSLFANLSRKVYPQVEDEYKYLQAYALYKQKLFSPATRYYQRFIEKFKNSRFLDRGYLELIDCLYNLNKLKEAERYAREFLDKFPHSLYRAEVLYSLGWVYYKSGDLNKAIEEFKTAADATQQQDLKINALCRVGDLLSEMGELDSAIQQYDYVLKNYPESIYAEYAQYQLAVDLYHKGDYDSAILALNNLVQNFPQSTLLDKVHYQLALGYFKKGEYESALEEINYLLAKYPDTDLKKKALLYKAVILFNLGDYQEALQLADSLPELPYAHFLSAQIYSREKKFDLAEQEYNWLKENLTDSELLPYLYLQIGELKFNTQDWDSALANFQNAIQLAKTAEIKQEAIYWRGWCYYKKGQTRRALQEFNKLFEIDKLWEQSKFYSAIILKEEKDYQNAIKLLQEVIANGRQFKRLAMLLLGDIYVELKEINKAIGMYKDLEGAPYDAISAEASFKIGEILESEGKLSQAILQYLKIASLYPDETPFVPKAKIRCARLLEKEGKISEALKIYHQLAQGEGEEAIYAREKLKELRTGR
jgi:tetratricopeptide (TPR) repeat protein